jgi:hypothetical protein
MPDLKPLTMTSTQKQNRKLWIIFLIALLIALLPWFVLA